MMLYTQLLIDEGITTTSQSRNGSSSHACLARSIVKSGYP